MPSCLISHDLDLDPKLPENILQIAIQQGENPDTKCKFIQELRDMIYEKGDFTPHRTDDDFLLKFLRARFFNLDNSYRLMCRYYQFRDSNREYHEKVHPLHLRKLGDDDIVTVTPYRDQIGHRIIIYRFGNWKPSKVPIADIFKATLILLEVGSMEPIAQVLGGVGVFDLKGLTINHIMQLTPSVAQKMINLMVTSMPIRTTAIHIVNQNWLFDTAFKIFKPFLNARMRERIFIHGSDMSSLHKHILAEHLPERYGGPHPDFPYTIWIEKLVENAKIAKELEQLGYLFEEGDFRECFENRKNLKNKNK